MLRRSLTIFRMFARPSTARMYPNSERRKLTKFASLSNTLGNRLLFEIPKLELSKDSLEFDGKHLAHSEFRLIGALFWLTSYRMEDFHRILESRRNVRPCCSCVTSFRLNFQNSFADFSVLFLHRSVLNKMNNY